MPNCLGIYAENNIIKYAKLTTDKNGGSLKLASYGVKFSDNAKEAIDEIIRETNSVGDGIATNIPSEKYESISIFNKLNKKDTKELVTSEFSNICENNGLVPSVLEMKYKLSKNTGDADKYKAICAYANKSELANVFNDFANCKIASIRPLGTSIINILPNKGVGEDIAVINIEDETVVTVVEKSEISDVISFPIGMKDVIQKLAEKYNSSSKAYEACKGVSAYIEDVYALEDADREVLDLLIPMLYDLRSKIQNFLEPHMATLTKIYITGTGVIVNNLDLYFHEVFADKTCQILVPYFLQKDSNNLKDIVEVNTAIALAFNGMDSDKDVEYIGGSSQTIMQGDALKRKASDLKEKTLDFLAANDFLGKKEKKKRAKPEKKINIEFNDEVVDTGEANQAAVVFGDDDDDEIKEPLLDPNEAWLARIAGAVLISFCLYSGAAYYTNRVIDSKIDEVNASKAQINGWIGVADGDEKAIKEQSQKYVQMRQTLEELLSKVTSRSISFDIPNFMSRLMFVMPENVKVTSIGVNNGRIEMNAESGHYAQLGYFVSRLKLDKVMENVDMEVLSMSGKIKIKISGEMP